MSAGLLTVVLLYEPATIKQKLFPLARVIDARLTADVARQAIAEAEARAAEFAGTDVVLGEVERAEANKLRDVLSVLLPGFFPPGGSPAPGTVM